MSAETKRLKTIHLNKDEALVITRGYRNWHQQQKILVCTKNLTVIKIMSISYPLLKQFVTLIKALMKHLFAKSPEIGKYF